MSGIEKYLICLSLLMLYRTRCHIRFNGRLLEDFCKVEHKTDMGYVPKTSELLCTAYIGSILTDETM